MIGTIKSMPEGKSFGFIKANNGKEYFFHRQEIYGHWEHYKVGKTVEFEEQEDFGKGPRACNVQLVHPTEG